MPLITKKIEVIEESEIDLCFEMYKRSVDTGKKKIYLRGKNEVRKKY